MEAERQPRKTCVNPKLAVDEYRTDLGPADCALADSRLVLGVAEEKELTVGPQGIGRRSPAVLIKAFGGELAGAA